MIHAGVRTALFGLFGLTATLIIYFVPSLYFLYNAPTAQTALQTAVTIVGLLVAFICLGRFRRSNKKRDLIIAIAVGIDALAFPLFEGFVNWIAGPSHTTVGVRSIAAVRILVGIMLALASMRAAGAGLDRDADLPIDGNFRSRHRLVLFVGPSGAAFVGVLVLAALMPPDSVNELLPSLSSVPNLQASVYGSSLHALAGALFVVAAINFASLARDTNDRFISWLGCGCALTAVANLDSALFPSTNPAWLQVGDFFVAATMGAWLYGSVREITSYWDRIEQLTRADERRSLARDLHDGLAQELAYLTMQSQATDHERARPEWQPRMRTSAERALAESRRAIAALANTQRLPLDVDVAATAKEIAERCGADLQINIAPVDLDPYLQESVVRLVREAVTNATRHGAATEVSVQLTNGAGYRLVVSDNGAGFDPDAESGGFGIISMRERAALLGGTCVIESSTVTGTTVTIAW